MTNEYYKQELEDLEFKINEIKERNILKTKIREAKKNLFLIKLGFRIKDKDEK